MRIARGGRPGPVHLSLPTDVLEAVAAASGPTRAAEARTGKRRQVVPDDDADAILARLRKAARPLILAGPAAMNRGGRQRLAALADACDVPVVGMQSPRGVNDPALGAFAEMLAQADCILLLGKRLDFTLKFGAAPAIAAACEFLQFDADAVEIERARQLPGARLVVQRQAGVEAAVAALLAAAARVAPRRGGWRSEVEQAIAYRPQAWAQARPSLANRLHPAQACRALQPLLDSHPDSVLVCDGGEIGQWAQACLQAPNLVVNGPARHDAADGARRSAARDDVRNVANYVLSLSGSPHDAHRRRSSGRTQVRAPAPPATASTARATRRSARRTSPTRSGCTAGASRRSSRIVNSGKTNVDAGAGRQAARRSRSTCSRAYVWSLSQTRRPRSERRRTDAPCIAAVAAVIPIAPCRPSDEPSSSRCTRSEQKI